MHQHTRHKTERRPRLPMCFLMTLTAAPSQASSGASIEGGWRRRIRRLLAALISPAVLLTCLTTMPSSANAVGQQAPPLMLANSYHSGIRLDDYWVSEKFDGIRAYWDGEKLLTRGGELVHAPRWFTAGLSDEPLDGELWAGRGNFALAVSTARRQMPNDAAWRTMRFMVFDLPAHPGIFSERLTALQTLVAKLASPWVEVVAQRQLPDHRSLHRLLDKTVMQGGEGLMLHRGASLYRAERSDDLLKLKIHDDAEARVIARLPGKGRHLGRLGALLVETPEGKRFRLGTGFSDGQRIAPPAVGSWVTYRYRGLHPSGIPRFASFLRVREDVAAAQK